MTFMLDIHAEKLYTINKKPRGKEDFINIKDLVFKDTIAKGYSFIRQCLLKDEWQEGAYEYNNAVKQLADSCMTTEEFVKQYLAHSE